MPFRLRPTLTRDDTALVMDESYVGSPRTHVLIDEHGLFHDPDFHMLPPVSSPFSSPSPFASPNPFAIPSPFSHTGAGDMRELEGMMDEGEVFPEGYVPPTLPYTRVFGYGKNYDDTGYEYAHEPGYGYASPGHAHTRDTPHSPTSPNDDMAKKATHFGAPDDPSSDPHMYMFPSWHTRLSRAQHRLIKAPTHYLREHLSPSHLKEKFKGEMVTIMAEDGSIRQEPLRCHGHAGLNLHDHFLAHLTVLQLENYRRKKEMKERWRNVRARLFRRKRRAYGYYGYYDE